MSVAPRALPVPSGDSVAPAGDSLAGRSAAGRSVADRSVASGSVRGPMGQPRVGRAVSPVSERVRRLDWERLAGGLDASGNAVAEKLLTPAECEALAGFYGAENSFRSRVIMGRHGYGRGEYKYFAYPLPQIVAELRAAFYPHLVPIANRWNGRMSIDVRYPAEHAEFLARCRKAGQDRPTPLLLQYQAGDYNCLHQDLYGEHVFPLQVAVLLSQPGVDFTGGEFVMTEQRPRMQSRPEVLPLGQGDAVIFAVHHRPVQGTRGVYRVNMRHGVSRLRSGHRHTLGVIFHDAK
jgi:uncharacterized protein